MRATSVLMLIILAWLAGVSPQKTVDFEKEKAELLKLHATGRRAHFQTDAELLFSGAIDDFVSVSSGKISRPTVSESKARFREVFRGAKYYEWDDVEPPIIRISNDGSMAWMIVRVRVRRSKKDSAGVEREEKFIYAGITTFEKREGRWVGTSNVSTFE
jgi:hypothetical protein